jgi:glutamate dehydrogenase (NADP+)
MFGQYKRLRNEFTGVLTGKGLEFGGSLIRPEATGYGTTYFAEYMLNTKGDSLKGKTVAISGSGNVAQYAVEKCIAYGAKVVTLSDSNGTIYDEAGIDKEKLAYIMELKNVKRGRIKEYTDKYKTAKYFDGQRPWKNVKCDVAMPNATQNELDGDDAKALLANGCICVSEGANMPSTLDAVNAFLDAKILYAPGKASNAGGVATSGLEMCQNSGRIAWTAEEVEVKLRCIMKNIHDNCVKYGTEADGTVNYVKGANIAGFIKVANAMLAQGLV